jgi:streptogramin lyase
VRRIACTLLLPWVLLPSCGSDNKGGTRQIQAETSSPTQSVVWLPDGKYPQEIVVAEDGTVWMTVDGGLARLDAAGHFNTVLDDGAADVIRGPDHTIWAAPRWDTIRRIDASGAVQMISLPRDELALLTSGDDELWLVGQNDSRARVARVNPDGRIGPARSLWTTAEVTALTAGAADDLWFVERSYDGPDAIARLTADGHYKRWRLTGRRSTPANIVFGPDGAAWFTEPYAHRIGRITANGSMADFALHPQLRPLDITRGTDGALWFTAERCLGRITTSGRITIWSIRDAVNLTAITAAPDGSLWIAEHSGAAGDSRHAILHHFTPSQHAVPGTSRCTRRTSTRRAANTRVTITYTKHPWFASAVDLRIRIVRGGKQLLAQAVPFYRGLDSEDPNEPELNLHSARAFIVRDLDGDREPEVTLELWSGGAHCCLWSRIYRYRPNTNTYVAVGHMWANGSATPKIRDLDGDEQLEFITSDERFDYDGADYASSLRPIQIWSYSGGTFRDVTRRFPKLIKKDVASLWAWYRRYRGKENVLGALGAWAADKYMLGEGEDVVHLLERDPLAAAVRDELMKRLRSRGYLRE